MESFLQKEKFRVSIYMLLADCFKERPQMESVIALAKLIETVEPNDKELLDKMIEEYNASSNSTVHRDFIELFIGPKSITAPPYGSIYMEVGHQIMGQSTLDAINMYNSIGFQKVDSFKQPADHIQVELEFMAALINKTMDSITSKSHVDALELINRQEKFLKNHLGSWIRPFAQAIKNNAKTLFYKNIAAIAEDFINQDIEDLEFVRVEFNELIRE